MYKVYKGLAKGDLTKERVGDIVQSLGQFLAYIPDIFCHSPTHRHLDRENPVTKNCMFHGLLQ